MSTIDQTWAYLQTQGMAAEEKRKGTGTGELGQDQFMELMLAQMKHQDPLKPMDNGEFIAQLAQFSTVSGVKGLEQSFSSLAASLQSNQALQATTLIGRTVSVPSARGILPEEGPLLGQVGLPTSAQAVAVEIRTAAGETIRRIDLGQLPAGEHTFAWDGLAADGSEMPAGIYTLAASRLTPSGAREALNTYTVSIVESVNLQTAGRGLEVNLFGLGTYAFADVREIG